MLLTRVAVTHPVFTTMMMVAILVLGLLALQRLGLDQYPNADVPIVMVATSYPGATPETVETEVTRPVEEALNAVGGVEEILSTSYEGRSMVRASFRLEVNGQAATQEVRDKVAAVEAQFPDDVEKPVISRFNLSDQPILSIAVTSPSLDAPQLTAIAEQRVVRQITMISGVGQATLVGGRKRQIDIAVDETKMRALGIGIDEVVAALRSGNQNRPAGSVVSRFGENTIQVQGRIEKPDGFLDMIIARRGGGPVYVRDIASVTDGAADPESLAIYNGEQALAIDVVKVQDANTVDTAADVRERLKTLNAELASHNVELRVVTDTSISIRESVDQVRSTLIEGAALAVAIVFLFLNSWRSTVITGLTLPIAMLGTLAVVQFLGFTLNTLSLLGLTLSIGVLIDDAIVVRENITRHLHMGKSHVQAAVDGTDEIGLAVIATTATIVAVFLPVAFMDGIVGRFFYEFGVTVSAAVLISLFVSFTLDPMLSSVWYDPDVQPDARRGPVGRLVAKFDRAFEALIKRYRSAIGWTLRHRAITLLSTMGVFVGSVFLVPLVGTEFVPTSDEGRFQINVTTPVDSSLDYTSAKILQIERALRQFPEVSAVYTTINTANAVGKNKASILVKLIQNSERSRAPLDLADPIRKRLSVIPGVDVSLVQLGMGGGDSPIQLSVLGPDRAVLERIAAELVDAMRRMPGMADVMSSASEKSSVLAVRLKREAASDLSVGVPELARMLAPLVGGEEATKWTDPLGETYDVVVRLPRAQRSDPAVISGLMLTTGRTDPNGAPAMVRLDQVADIAAVPAAAEIRRFDGRREVLVSAAISGRVLGDATAELEALVARKTLPDGYQIRFGGQSENMEKTTGHMITALGLAVIFVYLVLASQFGSFLQPLAIMAALPLSLVGVLLGLMAAGSTINMFSMIGFIMLMGLVTKNGILLVDFANRERHRGLSLHDALVSAGAVRFRPIVMTTLAMIFGMIPLAMAVDGGGAQRAPMAHAVIGGLLSSTLLTLVVVPVILSCTDGVARRLTRFLPKPPGQGISAGGSPDPLASRGTD
ncbi:efflux RND transporter permease subunit [Methylopila sp. 73B]|uniref:efflux RND transporter permease subunit n=1 Tax=Methylopila sp. 73B TaxID=1120792 RepID=UPI0003726FE7|nr:efflux RND transporter permease subunit [Methylopila sp. 73B]